MSNNPTEARKKGTVEHNLKRRFVWGCNKWSASRLKPNKRKVFFTKKFHISETPGLTDRLLCVVVFIVWGFGFLAGLLLLLALCVCMSRMHFSNRSSRISRKYCLPEMRRVSTRKSHMMLNKPHVREQAELLNHRASKNFSISTGLSEALKSNSRTPKPEPKTLPGGSKGLSKSLSIHF